MDQHANPLSQRAAAARRRPLSCTPARVAQMLGRRRAQNTRGCGARASSRVACRTRSPPTSRATRCRAPPPCHPARYRAAAAVLRLAGCAACAPESPRAASQNVGSMRLRQPGFAAYTRLPGSFSSTCAAELRCEWPSGRPLPHGSYVRGVPLPRDERVRRGLPWSTTRATRPSSTST